MESRWIVENTIDAQELLHKLKKHKEKNGLMIMKLDLKKAYDHLDWAFVIKALELWGFSSKFKHIIYRYISSVFFELLLDGSIAERFNLKMVSAKEILYPYMHLFFDQKCYLCCWKKTMG